ncbi:MAG: hypothetical protein J6U98_06825 [Abditibacteriota bacterium]|nr:hypothetical protein [Abditibacteriota bacterium]MBP5717575.1 hypothetical protein [Abditibacteriota bacterium]MBP5738356.1 hypothetical protein [Abditibacteriota bacterium]
MKKLIAVLSIFALACGASFAVSFDVNWDNDRNNNQYIQRDVTDLGTGYDGNIGFETEIINRDFRNGSLLDLTLYGIVDGTWLVDNNEPVVLKINGLENIDWADTETGSYWNEDDSYVALGFTFTPLPVEPDEPQGEGPWASIGGGMGMSEEYVVDLYLDLGVSLSEFIANGIVLNLSEYPFSDYSGFSVTEMNVQIHNYKPQQSNPVGQQLSAETTIIPEPATYAYGVMGLVSVFGLKRRIRK